MYVTYVKIRNWRNFRDPEGVNLRDRAFIVGPNASGKSNFLDVFRFLRDIADEGGGLQKAIADRGGIPKLRCLLAGSNPRIEIEVHFSETVDGEPVWKYHLGIDRETRRFHEPKVAFERVEFEGERIVDRPTPEDREDPRRLSQTYLQQIEKNQSFRALSDFLKEIRYLHLVPQLLKHPEAFFGPDLPRDPFGRKFLKQIADTPEKTRRARLKWIEGALKHAVPQLEHLRDIKDNEGHPHLEAKYHHWRQHGAFQHEDQFSDGTLRLIALLWSILDGDSLLLIEEPELSLHAGVARQIAALIGMIQKKVRAARKKPDRQIFISTHSHDLLSDAGIEGEEIIMLSPTKNGTRLRTAHEEEPIRALLEAGFTAAEAVIRHTEPGIIAQLSLFDA